MTTVPRGATVTCPVCGMHTVHLRWHLNAAHPDSKAEATISQLSLLCEPAHDANGWTVPRSGGRVSHAVNDGQVVCTRRPYTGNPLALVLRPVNTFGGRVRECKRCARRRGM